MNTEAKLTDSRLTTENGNERNRRIIGVVIAVGLASAALTGCSFDSEKTTPSGDTVYEIATKTTTIDGTVVTYDEKYIKEYVQEYGLLPSHSLNRNTVVESMISLDSSNLDASYDADAASLKLTATDMTITTDLALGRSETQSSIKPLHDLFAGNEFVNEFQNYADTSAIEAVNASCIEEIVDSAREDIEANIVEVFESEFINGALPETLQSELENMTVKQVKKLVDNAEVVYNDDITILPGQLTGSLKEAFEESKDKYSSTIDEPENLNCDVE